MKLIKTKKVTLKSVYFNQICLLISSVVIFGIDSLLFRTSFVEVLAFFFRLEKPFETFIYGTLVALFFLITIRVLIYLFPRHVLNDGGFNESIFKNYGYIQLLLFFIVVGFCEEALFRAGIQHFGFLITGQFVDKIGLWLGLGIITLSSLFFVIFGHLRYVTRPLLFIHIFMISMALGILFAKVSFWSAAWCHFLYDFGLVFIFKNIYTSTKVKNELKPSVEG